MPGTVGQNAKKPGPTRQDLNEQLVVEHEIRVRVRYADTNTIRVVYYANFVAAKYSEPIQSGGTLAEANEPA